MREGEILLCGRTITLGSRQDPYGAECELDRGHRGPHVSADPFGRDGTYQWAGGGMCAGDVLPVQSPLYVEQRPCDREFGIHEHDEAECQRILDLMDGGYGDDYYVEAYNREAEEEMLGRPLFPNEY